MAFITEDGSGTSDANSYTTTTYLTDYLTLRNITCCATETLQQANLVLATDYIELEYNNRIIGEKLVSTQALIFPRLLTDGSTLYPDTLQKAICSLSIKSANQDGVLLADSDKRVIREKVDVLEVEYDKSSKDEVTYNDIEALLRPYLIDDSSSEYLHQVVR